MMVVLPGVIGGDRGSKDGPEGVRTESHVQTLPFYRHQMSGEENNI